jgi:hypothetical protein
MAEASRCEETRGSEVTTEERDSTKKIKKTVGARQRADVWDRLYQLNRFAATLKQSGPTDDGYPVRKTVGRARPRER